MTPGAVLISVAFTPGNGAGVTRTKKANSNGYIPQYQKQEDFYNGYHYQRHILSGESAGILTSFLELYEGSGRTSRLAKLDTIIQRLYEDNIDGKISDERFSRMPTTYEEEQKQLESRSAELQHFIDSSKEQRLNVDSFLSLVKRYTDITELTAEIIRTFVERIEVFQPEKVPGTRMKKQTIVIIWNFIGAVDIPEEARKTA